jgi:hypothetical protein
MFEIGDEIVVGGFSGVIVGWYFDEGNVWEVELVDGSTIEMADDMTTR